MKTNPTNKTYNVELAIDSIAEDKQRNQNTVFDKDEAVTIDALNQDDIDSAKKKDVGVNLDDKSCST